MITYNNPPESSWNEILQRPSFIVSELESRVGLILDEIKTGGVDVLRKYTEKFDGVVISDFAVQEQEIAEAIALVDESLKEAILVAAGNIQKFHASQLPEVRKIETSTGVFCWQKR